MTAEERGVELLHAKGRDLPPLAVEFAMVLGRQVGVCLEVVLTAYTVYAQEVEKLPCTDTLYLSRPQDKEWFASKQRGG